MTNTTNHDRPRAAIYARYSTEKQNQASIEAQLRRCREYCDRSGYRVVATCTDSAMSGSTVLRPGFQNLVTGALNKEYDVIVTESLDRLSRDIADLAPLYRTLEFHGVALVTVADGKISPMHVMMQGAYNNLNQRNAAMQTHRQLEESVLKGKIAGGDCYGYRKVLEFDDAGKPVTGKVEVNPKEAEIVNRIFTEYAAGESPKAIAARLNREGIPGPRGGIWTQSTINGNRKRGTGILNNERYIGIYVWNRMRYRPKPIDLAALATITDRRTACPAAQAGQAGTSPGIATARSE